MRVRRISEPASQEQIMSFGRNPHVAKAEAAELKASAARDGIAREQAYRDAAHQWERAASRESDAKRKQLYEEKAATLRASADAAHDDAPVDAVDEPVEVELAAEGAAQKKPFELN
jgi:hypothetical protein